MNLLKSVLSCLFLLPALYANEVMQAPVPIATVYNSGAVYGFLNSVDHHPQRNLFCIANTHNNKISLYTINALDYPETFQDLCNPTANLCEPQHAVFSPDGRSIVVANWSNQTLTVYQSKEDGYFDDEPKAVIPPHPLLTNHRPHGIAFSPCGNYFGIAFGATSEYDKALALYSVANEGLSFELIQLLGAKELPGTPKGIAFSPDGACLLITFADVNQLVIYDLIENGQTIAATPRQVIDGEETWISRPEDVKFSANGNYCAVSNSDTNTITFYSFDKIANRITHNTPLEILQNPAAGLCFPHGIAFSPDGLHMLVTEFGQIITLESGKLVWDSTTLAEEAKFHLYRLLP